jgi:hypothetical protein
MVEPWQLLQPPLVMVVGMVAVSGHLLIWIVAGKAMVLLV